MPRLGTRRQVSRSIGAAITAASVAFLLGGRAASAGESAFLDLVLDGNGAAETFTGLPEAIGPVVVSFESRTFRSYDQYGGGECFERTFSIEGTPLVELSCPQGSGCETVANGVTVTASQFNAWREGGLGVGMGWQSSTCGLDWRLRLQYPFRGIDRVDQFVGSVGTSEGLPTAADDVFIEFTSTTYRSCDEYGGCTCYDRSLSFEDGATLSIDCPTGSGCLQASAVRVVDAETFNAWLDGGVDLTMDWDWSVCGLEWSVRYVYTTIEDCNGNGRPDEEDVALGLSPDCNGDGIPDDCQGIERIDLDATFVSALTDPRVDGFAFRRHQVISSKRPVAKLRCSISGLPASVARLAATCNSTKPFSPVDLSVITVSQAYSSWSPFDFPFRPSSLTITLLIAPSDSLRAAIANKTHRFIDSK